MKTVCLNMIVKNEKDVIETCLQSLLPFIDYWVIFDTGSTDGTQEIVQRVLKGIPGELHESLWIDFAHNRNEALEHAKEKADYLFFIDADEQLIVSKDFSLPHLDKDSYLITVRSGDGVDGTRIGFASSRLDWKWEGVLHEALYSSQEKSRAWLQGAIISHASRKGARAKDPNTFLKDALILEKAVREDPENSRNVFYLAQSYENAGCDEAALKSYKKRVAMESSDVQETYHALYRVGILEEKLENYPAALKSFSEAYRFRATRAEPLFHIAKIYRKMGNYLIGYLVLHYALSIPYPVYDFCIEKSVYDYALLIEFANCTLLLGKYEEGFVTCQKLLANPNLPAEFRDQITSNLSIAKEQLNQSHPLTRESICSHL